MGTTCEQSRPDHDRCDASQAAPDGRSRAGPRLPARRARLPARRSRPAQRPGPASGRQQHRRFRPRRPGPRFRRPRARSLVRRRIEATARANFSAQAQTHAAVIDLLDARNHSDLARRVDEMAILRFGLAAGVVVLEGPGRVPAGWHALIAGQIDMTMGDHGVARMGFHAPPWACSASASKRSRAWPWSAWPCGSRRARACWPSARPIPRASRRHGLGPGGLPGPRRRAHGRALADPVTGAAPGPDRLAGPPGQRAPRLAAHRAGLWRQRPGLSELPGAHRGEALSVADMGEITAAELRAYLAFRRAGRGRRPLAPLAVAEPVVDPRLPPLSRPPAGHAPTPPSAWCAARASRSARRVRSPRTRPTA
jgi:hypothetical protein